MKSNQNRLVIMVSILASFVAGVDGFIVNVALPTIAQELGGGLGTQQWTVDAYLITLGALILVAGSLSDLFGRKRVLRWGLVAFGLASVLCAAAPNAPLLIAGRALQGIAGALLVPSSLAILMAAFDGKEQSKAIGTWTAWGGISVLAGPIIGGLLVDAGSWRLIFAVNVVPIAVTLWLLSRLNIPQLIDPQAKVDWLGAVLGAAGLGGLVYGLIEHSNFGWGDARVVGSLAAGAVALGWFLVHEHRSATPMLPLDLFKVRNFWVGNLATLFIYAVLGVFSFVLTLFLQQVAHYPAVWAGMASIPATVVMFVLAPKFGALAGTYGPRWFMAGGPVVAALGFALMLRITEQAPYWSQVFPGMLVFSLGLSATVAPLTSAVLGHIQKSHSGIASAVNNAVARIAGLVSTAGIGVVLGPQLTVAGFHHSLMLMVALMLVGGAISAIGITNAAKDPS